MIAHLWGVTVKDVIQLTRYVVIDTNSEVMIAMTVVVLKTKLKYMLHEKQMKVVTKLHILDTKYVSSMGFSVQTSHGVEVYGFQRHALTDC